MIKSHELVTFIRVKWSFTINKIKIRKCCMRPSVIWWETLLLCPKLKQENPNVLTTFTLFCHLLVFLSFHSTSLLKGYTSVLTFLPLSFDYRDKSKRIKSSMWIHIKSEETNRRCRKIRFQIRQFLCCWWCFRLSDSGQLLISDIHTPVSHFSRAGFFPSWFSMSKTSRLSSERLHFTCVRTIISLPGVMDSQGEALTAAWCLDTDWRWSVADEHWHLN